MADGRRVGEFPYDVIGDQCLPLRVVVDECPEMSFHEIGGDCHRIVPLWYCSFVRVMSCSAGRNKGQTTFLFIADCRERPLGMNMEPFLIPVRSTAACLFRHSVFMSMTKRYRTSPLSVRSYASLTCWIGITSTSEVTLC